MNTRKLPHLFITMVFLLCSCVPITRSGMHGTSDGWVTITHGTYDAQPDGRFYLRLVEAK